MGRLKRFYQRPGQLGIFELRYKPASKLAATEVRDKISPPRVSDSRPRGIRGNGLYLNPVGFDVDIFLGIRIDQLGPRPVIYRSPYSDRTRGIRPHSL